jgi:hypothetical protein
MILSPFTLSLRYRFSQNLNFVKFDYIFTKSHQHSLFKSYTIGIDISYTFLLYAFGIFLS